MVLNALQIDPQRLWKSPWRWFSEDLLDCCTPLEVIKKQGITFNDFCILAKCNGADIESFRIEENNTVEQFRNYVKEICSNEGRHLVVSFSRSILGQTGDGHFSAISGYHSGKDLVLVMDTAKFKYPAFWCPIPLIFEAMKPLDSVTEKSRGYFIIQKTKEDCSSICKLSADKTLWLQISHLFSHHLPRVLKTHKPESISKTIYTIFKHFPKEIYSLVIMEEDNENLEIVYNEIRQIKLFHIVKQTFLDYQLNLNKLNPEIATLLLISAPSQLFKDLSFELKKEFQQLRITESLPKDLEKEILQLKYQIVTLTQQCVSLCEKLQQCSFDCDKEILGTKIV